MAEIFDLAVTDGNNTGRFPEGQAPSTVNNGARALEGILARGFRDTIIPDRTTTGSANAQVLTTNETIASLAAGMSQTWKAGYTNTGAMTLNVAATGAKPVKMTNGADPYAGAVTAGGYYRTVYDGAKHILMNPTPLGLTGDVVNNSGVLATRKSFIVRNSNWSFAADDRAKIHIANSDSVIGTLPTLATVGQGWYTTVISRVNNAVIASPSADIIVNDVGVVSSYTMSALEEVTIVYNDTTYFIITSNQRASTTRRGIVELATNAEAITGTDSTRAVPPSALKSMLVESPEYTITAAAVGTWTHGLGAAAQQMQAWVRCNTAIGGWAAGDELLLGAADHTGSSAVGVQLANISATQIKYAIGSGIYVINSTNGSLLSATSANFTLFFRAKPY